MPWTVEKQGSKWAVVKESTGKTVGTHPSKGKAMKQLKALYANEKK